MPFLASIGSALGANALKIGVALIVAVGLLGGGFVWGDEHATGVALKASANAAQTAVAAASKGYEASIADYTNKLKAQQFVSKNLSGELAQAKLERDAALKSSQAKVAHVVPANTACDLSAGALDLLRVQAARN
jgi:uncharacterized protein HemX